MLSSIRSSSLSHLAILEDEEADVSSMVDVVLSEERRGIVLDPNASQLVVVNVVHLKPTLHMQNSTLQ